MTITQINKEHIFVRCTDIVGSSLGGHYMSGRDEYRLPHNMGAVRDLIREGYPLEEHLAKLEAAFRRMVLDKDFMAYPEHDGLREYQNKDVNFLLKKNAYGVFNEQRTGKTPTICTVIGVRKVKTLVVVPTSLVYDWCEQVKRWAKMDAIAIKGTPAKRKKLYKAFHEREDAAVMVVSRGTAARDKDLLIAAGYDMMIIDEAHFLRNYTTTQSEAMYTLGRRAVYRYALTGTPASNTPDDIFGIFKFLEPTRFTSYWQFCGRYFKIDDGYFGKKVEGEYVSESREREYSELMEQYGIQRKRKDIMKWLKDKQYQKIVLEMDNKQRKAYDSMANTFVTDTADGGEVDAPSVLAQMTRLRQLSLAPEVLGVDAGSVKQDYVIEWLEDNGDEPLLIFTNFTSYLRDVLAPLLKKKKVKFGMITGEQTTKERKAAADKFQAGKLRVLLCNIEAAGVGLTLDRAETVIFLDRHYNPTWNAQAEDRLVATTEDAPQGAHVIDLVCKDSFDEIIHEMVEKKVDITKIVNNFSDLRALLTGGTVQ